MHLLNFVRSFMYSYLAAERLRVLVVDVMLAMLCRERVRLCAWCC